MGEDYWSYGLQPNRHVLDAFTRYHHESTVGAPHCTRRAVRGADARDEQRSDKPSLQRPPRLPLRGNLEEFRAKRSYNCRDIRAINQGE